METYKERLERLFRGFSKEMLEDHDHKDTCTDCYLVRNRDK